MKEITYKVITKKRLDEVLAKVGWYTRNHGAGTYRLYNPYGHCTAFQFSCQDGKENEPLYDLRIDEYTGMRPFGESAEGYDHCGLMGFTLTRCVLNLNRWNKDGKWEFVSISPKLDKNSAYVSFTAPFIPEKAVLESYKESLSLSPITKDGGK